MNQRMLRRLLVGIVIGLLIGFAVAAALVKGLAITTFEGTAAGAALAYLSAAAAGAMTGLIAGKPIWASGAKIEAGLKAFFGALIAAAGMFALRTWVGQPIDLSALGAGHGAIGSLPAASLPIVAAVLGGFFELDDTGGGQENAGAKTRVASESNGRAKARVAQDGEAEEEAEAVSAKRAKR